ncbi:hypothetical protein AXK11_02820 [Cephaloticoccus primus]|uniref:DUF4340 domain-containing protein n=1 Tax=Cephaloticoccus primus TaxID=1548207 RepID=A0A139SR95_9BACT|nr:DUF4340 domain-containing protein [Cephaloticoccus primus]KXU37125.1 hypothetical protein AXK11_02820 [Cephaloticoccus primus]
MRTKVTLVLLFLNVALFVFIFKFERGWRTEQAERETRRRVLGPEAASIQRLRISGPGLSTIELQRSGEQWALSSPIDWPANPHAVNRILNELQFLEHETSFSVADLEKNHQSLADYGLEHPRLTIEFTPTTPAGSAGSATSVTLQVGDETKVGNRLYLLSPERDRVHVVGLSLLQSLNLPLEELRTDNLFSIPTFEARSLNLQSASASRVRIRQEGKHWSFEAPIIARANKPQVELTINALNALRVHHFLPDNDSPTANAELRVSLIGNNRQQTLILLREVPGEVAGLHSSTPGQEPIHVFIAALEGKAPRFALPIPEPLLNTLRNAQDALRETRILDFEPEALTAVTLSAPNQSPLTLQQLRSTADGQNTWQLVRRDAQQSPQLQPADPQRMQELIRTLSQLAAQRFVSDAPSDADLENWGFNRPEREITLTLNTPASALSPAATAPTASRASNRDNGADSSRTLQLQIGRPSLSEPHLYARLGHARFVYQIPAEILEQTAPDPLLYRNRLLRELPEAARFSALTITDLREGHVAFEANIEDKESSATEPAQPNATAAAASNAPVQRLFGALRHLEAASLVQDHFSDTIFASGAERSWRWRIDTTVQLPSGGGGEQSQASTLFLSERLGGDLQLAGSPELGLVFAVNQELLDALWQLNYREPAASENTQPASAHQSSAPAQPTARPAQAAAADATDDDASRETAAPPAPTASEATAPENPAAENAGAAE